MDALKFIEERNRMCKSFSPDCEGCRIEEVKPAIDECVSWMIDNAEKAVRIVEDWSAAHPRKTRQDVFLEQYPTARVTDDGALGILPCLLDETLFSHCRHGNCDGKPCCTCDTDDVLFNCYQPALEDGGDEA